MVISVELLLEHQCLQLRWCLIGAAGEIFILLSLAEKKTTLVSGAVNSPEFKKKKCIQMDAHIPLQLETIFPFSFMQFSKNNLGLHNCKFHSDL